MRNKMARRIRRRKIPMSGDGRGATCSYCKRPLEATSSPGKLAATRDHVTPRSRWAPIDLVFGARKVWCCRQCNSIKADMMPWEWTNFMARNPEWWRRPEIQDGSNNRGAPSTEREEDGRGI